MVIMKKILLILGIVILCNIVYAAPSIIYVDPTDYGPYTTNNYIEAVVNASMSVDNLSYIETRLYKKDANTGFYFLNRTNSYNMGTFVDKTSTNYGLSGTRIASCIGYNIFNKVNSTLTNFTVYSSTNISVNGVIRNSTGHDIATNTSVYVPGRFIFTFNYPLIENTNYTVCALAGFPGFDTRWNTNTVRINGTRLDFITSADSNRWYDMNITTYITPPESLIFISNFTNLANTAYLFNASVRDTNGVTNSTYTINLTVDSTNPEISYSGNTPTRLFDQNLSYQIILYEQHYANATVYLYNDSGIINSVFYNNSLYCYQEFANQSTACGGLDTGTYGKSETSPYVYINYTKPLLADNQSLWYVYAGTNFSSNISIPNACWIQSPLQLRIHSNTFNNPNLIFSCFNGSEFQTLASQVNPFGGGGSRFASTVNRTIDGNYTTGACFYDGDGLWRTGGSPMCDNAWIKEEAMYWHMMINGSFNNLDYGTYYINTTLNELSGQYTSKLLNVSYEIPAISYTNDTINNQTYRSTSIQVIFDVNGLNPATAYLYQNNTLINTTLLNVINGTAIANFSNLPLGTYSINASVITNSSGTNAYTVIGYFNTTKYTVSFPYPNNGYSTNNILTYGFTTIDQYYDRALYNITRIGTQGGIMYDACYQESFNVSNQVGTDGSCGLNYTGKATGITALMTDGNYNTSSIINSTTIYINYTLPSSRQANDTVIWTIKVGSFAVTGRPPAHILN